MAIFIFVLLASVRLSFDLHRQQHAGSGRISNMLKLDGAALPDSAGAPAIPFIPLNIALHLNEKPIGIRVIDVQFERVATKSEIPPIPEPVPLLPPELRTIKPKRTPPDPSIYDSKSAYPSEYVRLSGFGRFLGWPVASVVLSPFRYDPSTGELFALRHIEFEIETEPCAAHIRSFSPMVAPHVESAIKALVLNPEIVQVPTTNNGFDYLIVTNEYLADTFEAYARWKRLQGYRTEVRTIEWVESNYPGRDRAEKLRNYLKTLTDSGVLYVLIGGDEGAMPVRVAYAMTCNYMLPNEDSIRADLYFADIDGTWDADGDGVFGEVEDSVDMYPDFVVGRLPVHYMRKTGYYLRKLKEYELMMDTDYQNEVLLLGMVLWDDPYTPSGEAKELIDSLYIPDSLSRVKLYESWNTAGAETTLHELNDGPYLINHNGHGWYYGIWLTHDASLNRGDMNSLTNDGRYGIFFSTGCWVAAFDYNSIAETYVLAQNGGIAFIGNSRYGWGSPGNPGFGYSDVFDNAFFDVFYNSDIPTLGLVLAVSKARFVPLSQWRNVYRWHEYQINLLGDPSLPVMRGRPKGENLEVEYPTAIFYGDTVTFTVLDGNHTPIAGATVALSSKNGRLLDVAHTGIDGRVSFVFDQRFNVDTAIVWVGSYGYVPQIDTIDIAFASTGVFKLETPFLEGTGEARGLVHPGDTLSIVLPYRLDETQAPFAVYVEYDDSVVEWVKPGSILIDTPQTLADTLRFKAKIKDDARNGTGFSIRFTGEHGIYLSSASLPLVVASPLLQVVGIQSELDTTKADPPFFNGRLTVFVKNSGLATAHDVRVVADVEGFGLSFRENRAFLDSIPPDSTVPVSFHFIAQTGTASGAVILSANFEGRRLGWSYEFSGVLLPPRWHVDFESSFGPEVRMGGHWHVVDYEAHSGTHSVYCGIDSAGYLPNWSDTLEFSRFTVPYDARLSFWMKFEAANFGVDGIYIFVEQEGHEYLLDFIGSGGALNDVRPLDIELGWAQYTYDLSFLEPLEPAQLRIVFESDSDSSVALGFFIDDIEIDGDWFEFGSNVDFINMSVYPNPAKDVVSVMLAAPMGKSIMLKLFDSSGRLLKSECLTVHGSFYELKLSLRDRNGRPIPSGIYFLYAEGDNGLKASAKLVVSR